LNLSSLHHFLLYIWYIIHYFQLLPLSKIEYLNSIELKDPNGNKLSLTSTNAGSYYDYLKKIIEESLNNFLSDTKIPWTQKEEKYFPENFIEN
jgi:hypothetical protein